MGRDWVIDYGFKGRVPKKKLSFNLKRKGHTHFGNTRDFGTQEEVYDQFITMCVRNDEFVCEGK